MRKKLFSLLALFMMLSFLLPPGTVSAASYDIDFEPECAAIEFVNLDKDIVLYSKNADEKREPASLTKIMTYIVVVEHVEDLETQVTVEQKIEKLLQGTNSSLAGLKVGDVLTVRQLLHCMMIPSGNDAALCLANFVGGGDVSAFVQMMNDKAAELGCNNTHFSNPHGLHADDHYTTAHDLSIMTQYALRNCPDFQTITKKARETYQPVGGPDAGKTRTLVTTNMLIDRNAGTSYYYPYATGVKTGSTTEAGYCLISSAAKDGYSYLCVALGAPMRDANGKRINDHPERTDSVKLFKWAFENFRIKPIVTKDETFGEVKLTYAWNKDTLLLSTAQDFSTLLPKDVSTGSIVTKKDLPESVEAPVKKGDKIGTLTLIYADRELATIDLVASESVERSELLKGVNTVKAIFTSKWFIAVIMIIVLLVLVYILIALIYNRKKKKLRKVKNYRKM